MAAIGGKHHFKIAGAILIVIVAVFVAMTIAMYSEAFKATETVTLRADRSGLQMQAGNRVKLNGVDVGTVSDVRHAPDTDGAEIELALDPESIGKIPANVRAELQQLTAFGNKHVALSLPEREHRGPGLRAGDVIGRPDVSVEINSVFANVQNVLDTAKPDEVNALLGTFANTLRGRGEKLGQLIDRSHSYLARINRDLPQLRAAFAKGGDVAGIYAAAMPDIMALLDNGSAVSRTVVQEQDSLTSVLRSVTDLSRTGQRFLGKNAGSLAYALDAMLPTTRLLEKYSPGLPCFLKGMDKAGQLGEGSWGDRVPGVTARVSVLPGNEPYKYPENLPVMAADDGPKCYGMPEYSGHHVPEELAEPYDRGGNTWATPEEGDRVRVDDRPLVVQLFGPLAAPGAKGGR